MGRLPAYKQLDNYLSEFIKNRKDQYRLSRTHFINWKSDEVYVNDENMVLKKLVKDGHIVPIIKPPTSTQGQTLSTSPDYFLTFDGRLFIERGGYTNDHRTLNRKNNWTVAKTIAAILNAIVILLIMAWSVKVSIEANEDRVKNTKLSNDNAELQRELDSCRRK